ncbi:MAG: acetate uptake transporter [archaeon]|jgi:succinate-acetate transporter protein|nr:acetate uptake transporter [archaeon]
MSETPYLARADTLLGNPAPLGLFGFGMTTVLLNLSNAGYFGTDSTILAMGIFYGGLAQIVAGLLEFRKGNTFGTVAFLSYGFFWESFVGLLVLPGLWKVAAPTDSSLAAYLAMWGIFTLLMFIGTLRLNGALMFVFGSLFLLFFMLAGAFSLGTTTTSGANLLKVAGYEGVICGLSAMYTAIAQVLNEVYKKTILPILPVRGV